MQTCSAANQSKLVMRHVIVWKRLRLIFCCFIEPNGFIGYWRWYSSRLISAPKSAQVPTGFCVKRDVGTHRVASLLSFG